MKLIEHLPMVVADNEKTVREAFERGDYLFAFILMHTLVESLLRSFLEITEQEKVRFYELVNEYEKYLKRQHYPMPEFVEELRQFNDRRNKVVHQLWKKGYTLTNRQSKRASEGAFILYGLFIEWLETFDPEIINSGFTY